MKELLWFLSGYLIGGGSGCLIIVYIWRKSTDSIFKELNKDFEARSYKDYSKAEVGKSIAEVEELIKRHT